MEDINDLKVGETFQLGNRKLRLEEGNPDGCGNCFYILIVLNVVQYNHIM